MATNFIEVADAIYLQMYTRHNIAMYDSGGTMKWPAEPSTGAVKVRISIDELKQLAGLKRMRKQYSKGKGGVFPQLINKLNHGDDRFHASEDKDGSLIVIFFPDIPSQHQYQWTEIKAKNHTSMQESRVGIESGNEDADDYRLPAENAEYEFKFREWED